ncbi:MAG: LpxD N-terminal domain-containing protein, partial [Pseudomonadota bacterium]
MMKASFPDPRFYHTTGPVDSVKFLALTGLAAESGAGPLNISNVSSIASANALSLIFIDQKKHLETLSDSVAFACCLTTEKLANDVARLGRAVVCLEPRQAFAVVADYLHKERRLGDAVGVSEGASVAIDAQVHPTAIIADGAEIGRGSTIGPYTVIGPGVRLGEGCIV